MKTDDLIERLAADLTPVQRSAATKRLATSAIIGGSITLALVWIAYGLRADLPDAAVTGSFWTKAVFTAAVAALAFIATERAGRPGVRSARYFGLVVLPFVLMLCGMWMELVPLAVETRKSYWLGETWRSCPWSIMGLSLPILFLLLRAFRHFAPTRPARAGFALGLLSGGLAATLYGLHCPERTVAFVATWYGLGMLGSGLLGAIAARRMLRW